MEVWANGEHMVGTSSLMGQESLFDVPCDHFVHRSRTFFRSQKSEVGEESSHGQEVSLGLTPFRQNVRSGLRKRDEKVSRTDQRRC